MGVRETVETQVRECSRFLRRHKFISVEAKENFIKQYVALVKDAADAIGEADVDGWLKGLGVEPLPC